MNLVNSNPKKTKHRAYIEVFLPFYLILTSYSIGSISALNLGSLGLLIISVVVLVNGRFKITINKYHIFFLQLLAFLVIRDVIRIVFNSGSVNSQLNKIIEYIFLTILVVIITSTQYFNENVLFNAWKVSSIIIILGEIYHIILIFAFGQRVQPITFIPGYVMRDTLSIYGSVRPLSFFTEPGGIATALLPMLFLSLKRKKTLWAIIITIAILLSTSSVGVLLAAIMWSYTVFFEKDSFKFRFLILAIIITITILYLNIGLFASSLEKLTFVFEGESTFNSRVANGFRIVFSLNPLEFIIGTNFNEISDYVYLHSELFYEKGMVLAYLNEGRLFINTISYIIIKYGLVGLFLYVRAYVNMFRIPHYRARAYIVICLASAFGQSVFMNASYYLIVILILLMAYYRDEEAEAISN